jgi:hypothetical protein
MAADKFKLEGHSKLLVLVVRAVMCLHKVLNLQLDQELNRDQVQELMLEKVYLHPATKVKISFKDTKLDSALTSQ